MLICSHIKEFFSYIQTEFPLTSLSLVPLVLCTPVLASSIQIVVEALKHCD